MSNVMSDFKFKRSLCINNMTEKVKLRHGNNTVTVDPELLFQHLSAILLLSKGQNISMDVFS